MNLVDHAAMISRLALKSQLSIGAKSPIALITYSGAFSATENSITRTGAD
jgi:hypothetical protein